MIGSEPEPAACRRPVPPPLWSLPLALLLVATLLLPLFFSWREVHAVQMGVLAAEVERIVRAPGRPCVAAISDSILRSATGEDAAVEATARDRGLELVWAHISQGGANWDFEAWLERTVAARPDLLLIPDNVLFYPPQAGGAEGRLITFAVDTRSRVRRFLLRGDQPAVVLKPVRLDERQIDRLRAVHRQLYRPLGGRRIELLRRARLQGVHVVVLVMPLSASGRAAYTDNERAAVENALSPLPADEGISVWRCPLELADGDFTDGRHFSAAASRRYVVWLVGAIDAWWRGRAPR